MRRRKALFLILALLGLLALLDLHFVFSGALPWLWLLGLLSFCLLWPMPR